MDPQVLRSLSYGMYIVSAARNGILNGQVANAVFQVCSQPPVVAACINRQNLTHGFMEASGAYSVSVLDQDTPLPFIGRFGFRSGRDLDKFKGVEYRMGSTGAPVVVEHAVGYLEARVVDRLEVGTHTIFVGHLVDGAPLTDRPPMTYAYYHHVKGGKSPKTAPTYLPEREHP